MIDNAFVCVLGANHKRTPPTSKKSFPALVSFLLCSEKIKTDTKSGHCAYHFMCPEVENVQLDK